MAIKRIAPNVTGEGRRVGIVVSRFNGAIGERLLAGALRALAEARRRGAGHRRRRPCRARSRRPLALQRLAQARRLRCAGRAGRGDSRRDLSLRDRRQRVGGGRRERAARIRHSHRQRHPDDRHRRAGGWRAPTPKASRRRRRRSSSRTCWTRSMRLSQLSAMAGAAPRASRAVSGGVRAKRRGTHS